MTDRMHARQGRAAVALLVREPAARFPEAFNRRSQMASGEFGGQMYERTLARLAADVDAGTVQDVPALVARMHAVLSRNVLHARVRSFHRSNPRLVTRCRDTAVDTDQSIRLFVTDGDPDRHCGRGPDPADAAQHRELLALLLREARWLGPLRVRVFREVRRFELARGTTFGAFQAVARLAVVDDRGRVVRFRRQEVVESAETRPPAAVVRRVRKLYRDACRHIDTRAYVLGYRVKPLS